MLRSPVTGTISVGLEPCGVFPHSAWFAWYPVVLCNTLLYLGRLVKRLAALSVAFSGILEVSRKTILAFLRSKSWRVQHIAKPAVNPATLEIKLGDVFAERHLDNPGSAGQRLEPRRPFVSRFVAVVGDEDGSAGNQVGQPGMIQGSARAAQSHNAA